MRDNCRLINIIHCQGGLNTILVRCLTILWACAFTLSVCDLLCIYKVETETEDCSHSRLRKIPDDIPNSTRNLNMQCNFISNISDYSFENLPHLQHLDVSFNKVAYIDNNAFVGPTQLLSLDLTFCSLSADDLPQYKNLEYLEDLEFGSCDSPSLSAFTFKNLKKLRWLGLSNNNIKYIDQEAFIGLESLEVLDLSHNELCISELHPIIFQPLQSLFKLLIFTEKCNFTCNSLKANLFLPTLKYLTIGVQDLPIDPIRWGMTNLTFLALEVSCNVNISGNSFLNVENVTNLYLLCSSQSRCASMMSDAFQNLLNLSTLFINMMRLKNIPPMLSNALKNNFKSLRKIQIRSNERATLSRTTLSPFENSNIEELILEFMDDVTLKDNALRFLPKSLHTINIYARGPVNLNSVIASGFDKLPNLSLLKMLYQDFQAFVVCIGSKGHLGQTYRRHPSSFPDNKYNITRFKNVRREEEEEEDKYERTNNKWKQRYHKLPKLDQHQSFSNQVNQQPEGDIPTKALMFDISNNDKSFRFDDSHVVTLEIDSLDISFNKIYDIPLAFGNIFSQVRIINLSDAKVSEIADGTFQSITNLTHLDLKNNLINMSEKDILFQNLLNLKYLNLANNNIRIVPKSMLIGARKLETLNLSLNKIVSINVDIYHTKLKTLDLSSNNIQFISDSYARQIEQLCKQSHLAVNLAGNPLKCTCDNLQFFQMTASCGLTLQDAHSTYCEFENETRAILDDVNRILDDLERECKSKIPILVGSVVASICLLLVLVGALAYRYRWKLRYLYYASKLIRLQTTHEGAAYERIFDYDAFVSYTDTNNAFVRNEMIPKLEVENNIRLCVHERDFIAGESVACNISRAIQSSKRTILVLTEDFFKSDWCMYELNMARVEDLYSERNVILIIFLCDIDLDKLPLDVLDLVRWKTYLKYSKEGTDRDIFWEKCVEFIL